MRVLHVLADIAPRHGGPSTAVWALAQAAAEAGHTVRIVATDDGAPNSGRELIALRAGDSVTVHLYKQRPNPYRFSFSLWRDLVQHVDWADVVHVHSLYLSHSVRAARLAWRLDRPYIVRPHGSLGPETVEGFHPLQRFHYHFLDSGTLRRSAAIHVTSDRERQDLLCLGFPDWQVRLVPLPVAARCSSGASPPKRDGRKLLFFGRLAAKKHPEILVDALGQPGMEDFSAVFVGPDDEWTAAELRRRSARMGVATRVTFRGPLYEDAQVADALQSAACLVLPSEHENFGIAVVESLQCGTPVVVSNRVALHHYVRQFGAGEVMDALDASSVAHAVEATINVDSGAMRERCLQAAAAIVTGSRSALLAMYGEMCRP